MTSLLVALAISSPFFGMSLVVDTDRLTSLDPSVVEALDAVPVASPALRSLRIENLPEVGPSMVALYVPSLALSNDGLQVHEAHGSEATTLADVPGALFGSDPAAMLLAQAGSAGSGSNEVVDLNATPNATDTTSAPPADAADKPQAPKGPSTADLMKKRVRLARAHKWLGISTWGAMTITTALGFFQYINLYGVWADRDDTRCVQGNAIFGQAQCSGQPLPHLLTSVLTSGLYFATFGVSLAMPDPLKLSEGNSAYAKKLRKHKRLRWAHFGGMVAQILLGVLSANSDWFGVDRANDYKAQRAFATTHLLIGTATWVTLTWSGAIML